MKDAAQRAQAAAADAQQRGQDALASPARFGSVKGCAVMAQVTVVKMDI